MLFHKSKLPYVTDYETQSNSDLSKTVL